MNRKIVAVISGGLDSTCFMAQFEGDDLYILSFDYGQKGIKELERANMIVELLQEEELISLKEYKTINMNFMKDICQETQLTNDYRKVSEEYDQSVVVPLRNAIFATIAMSYAYSIEAEAIAMGPHMDDAKQTKTYEPFYPDCTPEFYEVLTTALHLGHFRFQENKPYIVTPSLLGQRLRDVVKFAHQKWGEIVFYTWSCYDSPKEQCGVCLSCRERRKVFKQLGIEDRTVYLNDISD